MRSDESFFNKAKEIIEKIFFLLLFIFFLLTCFMGVIFGMDGPNKKPTPTAEKYYGISPRDAYLEILRDKASEDYYPDEYKYEGPSSSNQYNQKNCSICYPSFCIPNPPPDLDCNNLSQRNFRVVGCDPHNFDSDRDGIGCESK